MSVNKIKEMLQNKKVVAISSVVAGALVISIVGTMILNNKDIKNNIAIENESEEIEQPKELEEKLVSSNLSEEVVVENEVDTLDEKEPVSTNDENSTSNKEDTESTTTEKVGTSNNSSNNTNTSNNSSSSNGAVSNANTHTHTWVEVYKDVPHSEEGHYETVVIKEAWTESIPVYEEREVMICNDCNIELTVENRREHVKNHLLNGGKGSWREEWKQVQVGTNTVNHPAVTEKKWIVDKSAWTEKVLNGYKCNDCGVSK